MYKSASRYLQHQQARSGSSPLDRLIRKETNRYNALNNALKHIRAAAKRGKVLVGRVKSVQPYGAFIAIGAIDGLVHISEIADHYVHNVQDILRPGMSVRVIVLHVGEQGKRIALSMRQVPQ